MNFLIKIMQHSNKVTTLINFAINLLQQYSQTIFVIIIRLYSRIHRSNRLFLSYQETEQDKGIKKQSKTEIRNSVARSKNLVGANIFTKKRHFIAIYWQSLLGVLIAFLSAEISNHVISDGWWKKINNGYTIDIYWNNIVT